MILLLLYRLIVHTVLVCDEFSVMYGAPSGFTVGFGEGLRLGLILIFEMPFDCFIYTSGGK